MELQQRLAAARGPTIDSPFLDALAERVLIFDGAMGTQIHAAELGIEDYWDQENNSEILNLSRPDVIRDIHARYLEAGADCVETNTFGANVFVQSEYDQAEAVHELNLVGARLAREVASSFTDRPRFVVGSIGPGTQLPTIGQTTFDALVDSYAVQMSGLVSGGVDALLIETAFDLLQVKAALAACMDAFGAEGRRVPVMVQVTIQPEGTMLLGSEIGAAVATLHAYDIVDAIGINCATGPVEMIEHVRSICQSSPRYVSVQPNAGLPEMIDGRPVYNLSVGDFLAHHELFVREFGVNAVGGCCGTTPEFIAALVASLGGEPRPTRGAAAEPAAASLYIPQPLHQETSFFVIGERCNAQGSRRFKRLVDEGDWDQTVKVAQEQVREGAHAIDVNVDFVGRDGAVDMAAIMERFRTQCTLPIVLDSTEPEVIEAGLKQLGGRPVINSINLEEGLGPDTRIERNLASAVRYGAAVVCLAIDERGQATTADWKVEACREVYDVAVGTYGLHPEDLIFDVLVLPVSTGQEELRRAAVETLDGVARVKQAFPASFTSLGVSNVSFGLVPAARQVLNSVFLHEAVARGLDMAIVSPAQILPMNRIDDEQRRAALDLIHDRHPDALQRFIELFEGAETKRQPAEERALLPVEERLKRRIIDGDRDGLHDDLAEALVSHGPLDIINDHLLDGMKVVGDLFASGEMQLPFVLQSAETMKAAVAYLEPHMEKAAGGGKGTIVLATVKGDVHDIGKNLVDIILSNNGYTVHNLGIKQPIGSIIEAAQTHSADAIGLSGLLVKSTLVMREDLEELNRRRLAHLPVILGGAALTRSYVEVDLRKVYEGRVFYGRDAFEGLRTMDSLMAEKAGGGVAVEAPPKERRVRATGPTGAAAAPAGTGRSDVAIDVPIPEPPFWGTRVVKGLPVADVAAYLNRIALFRGRWELRRTKGQSPEDYEALVEREAEPALRDLIARAKSEQILQPAVVYGYFPAHSDGDDLVVLDPDDRARELVRFTFPRQQRDRRLCIADFFRPASSGEHDVVAFHLVTMGSRVAEAARALFEANRYQEYFYLHGFGVEMAEALAEYWHKRIREELGIAGRDATDMKELFDQGYQGSRYSFGYPACPNLEDQQQIFTLLEPERIGVSLTEEFQLDPEQSTSAIIVHHSEARYFSVGRTS